MSSYGPAASHPAGNILFPLGEMTRAMVPDEADESHLQGGEISVEDPKLADLEVLGQRCKEGDLAAWSPLFQIAWPLLVTFVHRLYRSFDQQDAEDVAQASLQLAVERIETYSGQRLFRGWLFGIASNQATTFFRRRSAKKRGLGLLCSLGVSADQQDDAVKSPAEATAENDRAAILHRAIEELGEVDRDLVHLHFFGGLTFSQIGEARDMSPKTVCTRLTRCKRRLLVLLSRSNLTSSDG